MARKVVPLRPQMNAARFQAAVRDRSRIDHMVRFTDHSVERMSQRNLTRRMVLRVIQRGTIDGRQLAWSEDHGTWTAPVVGIAAGVQVTAVCAIRDEDLIVIVVTAYGGEDQ